MYSTLECNDPDDAGGLLGRKAKVPDCNRSVNYTVWTGGTRQSPCSVGAGDGDSQGTMVTKIAIFGQSSRVMSFLGGDNAKNE